MRGAQQLPQVQVAVHAVGRDRVGQPGHRVVDGADRVDVRREHGRLARGGVQARAATPAASSAGSRSAVPSASAQLGVHHGDGLADPRRLAREVAAHLVGAQVRLGEQVAHRGQGHRPAVGGVAGEVLQHRQRRRLAVERALDGPLQRGDLVAAHRPQRPVQLQVRVHARVEPPEQLEDGLLAEHHRRVGLLGAHHPAQPGRRRASAPGSGTNRTSPIVRPARIASSSQAVAVWSHRAS